MSAFMLQGCPTISLYQEPLEFHWVKFLLLQRLLEKPVLKAITSEVLVRRCTLVMRLLIYSVRICTVYWYKDSLFSWIDYLNDVL